MNAKKCKAIRRSVREVAAFRAQVEGVVLPPNGLLYKDTAKVNGYRTPSGWLKANFLRLMVEAPKSPWADEARAQMRPEYARTAVNVPGSPRWLYRRTKRATR